MKSIVMLASVAAVSLASSAMAGFVATTGVDTFTYTPVALDTAANPAVGATISVANNPLSSYTPDGPSDPQITGADINLYLFSLDVSVLSTPSPGIVRTTGTYSVFYDLGNDGTPDIRVSSGTASLDLAYLGTPGTYLVNGALTQVLGPDNPAFADLSYGGHIVLQGGLYVGAADTGTLNLVLSQTAVVPEPVTLGSVAAAGLMMLRRRRA